MVNEKISRRCLVVFIVLGFVFVILAIVGFVLYFNRKAEEVIVNKDGGKIVLNYSSDPNFLNITDAVPTTDAVGVVSNNEGNYFDFSVDAEVDEAKTITYELSIKKVSGNINSNDIMVYLEKEDSGTYNSILKPVNFKEKKNKTEIGTSSGSMVLCKEEINKSIINNYRIRTWVAENSIITNANYKLELNIVAKAK